MGQITVFPKTTLPVRNDMDLGSCYWIDGFALMAGEKYVVRINDVVAPELAAVNLDLGEDTNDIPALGNQSLVSLYGWSGEDTGEDYLLLTSADGSYTVLFIESADGTYPDTVTLSISKIGYTSEQYKYLLLRQLQKYFSMPVEKDRYYTRDFFQKLLDGVEVTETSYNEFVGILEDNLQYCAENGVIKESNITQAMIDERGVLLVNAFEKIGITLVIQKSDYSGSATFTKPDGTVLVYNVTDGSNNFYINAVSGQEYSYAKKASPYYQMLNDEVKELCDENYQMCGPDCYWSFDADTATMTITGKGPYIGVTKETQIGSGTYTTLILGAEVEELNYNEASNSASLTKVILLQPKNFPLRIASFGGYNSDTSKRTWDVYTDNEAFRAATFGTGMVINWHTLDEWEG